jgi:hypothetical protein
MNVIFFDPLEVLQHPEEHPGLCPSLSALMRSALSELGAVAVLVMGAPATPEYLRAWQWVAASVQLPIVGQTDGIGSVGGQVERWMSDACTDGDPEMMLAGYAVMHTSADWLPHQRKCWVQLGPQCKEANAVNALFKLFGLSSLVIDRFADDPGDEPDWAREVMTRPAGGVH